MGTRLITPSASIVNLTVLAPQEYAALDEKLNVLLPEDQATEAFWEQVKRNEGALKSFYSQFGEEEQDWEVPWHSKRCPVIYSYLHTERLYTPSLMPNMVAIIPDDGKPWYAEFECYTEKRLNRGGNPTCLGHMLIFEGVAYTSAEYGDLVEYTVRLMKLNVI